MFKSLMDLFKQRVEMDDCEYNAYLEITDVVETGFLCNNCISHSVGGSIDVEVIIGDFSNNYSETLKSEILEIIDYFDHATITPDPRVAELSERVIVVSSDETCMLQSMGKIIFDEISFKLFNPNDLIKVKVTLGKTSIIITSVFESFKYDIKHIKSK